MCCTIMRVDVSKLYPTENIRLFLTRCLSSATDVSIPIFNRVTEQVTIRDIGPRSKGRVRRI